jgi:TfoX/Sxy family transcriptional regulator of competence genes
MIRFEFEAKIKALEDRANATYIEFPYDVKTHFGKRGHISVKAWFDGVFYRGSMVAMAKNAPHILLLRSDVRDAIGKKAGEQVQVAVEHDTEERTVEVPSDMQAILGAHPDVEARFLKMSYTHRKEYVEWITSAKKPETRENRLQKLIEKLEAH